jgi:hypothetical protein
MKNSKTKLFVIGIVILILGGITLVGLNQCQEAKRNRAYEESLVQALKNSYRDLEEIELSDPSYLNPPGSWICHVELTFSDGMTVEYGIGHGLGDVINRSAIEQPKILELLDSYFGETTSNVRVTYSNGEQREE